MIIMILMMVFVMKMMRKNTGYDDMGERYIKAQLG